jgi:hypothetical protein
MTAAGRDPMRAVMFPPTRLLRQLLHDELRQRREEGCDVSGLELRVADAGGDRERLLGLYEELMRLEPSPDFPFEEPSELADIRAARPKPVRSLAQSPHEVDDVVADRIHGGWLGRCAGLVLGKPLEMSPFVEQPGALRRYLEVAGAYPLDDFVPQDDAACRAVGIERLRWPASQRGSVCYVEPDDDIQYTIAGLNILERKGAAFSTADVAAWWMQNLGIAQCFTAEAAAYRNLVLLDAAHDPHRLKAADWERVRTWLNPYREWIGAQIRADGWALACPGDPTRAAEFAWRDARLSHVKNGVYGEMFCAAMIAAALVCDDPMGIVAAGLGEIPQRSRLADAIRRTIEKCRELDFSADRFEAGHTWLWQEFAAYHPIHTINNAAAVVMALLLGGHDYQKVITIAVMAGWDTDCNGATAGCICGSMLGAKRLPARWTTPLRDTLMSGIAGFHPIAISECARRQTAVARQLARV